MLQAQCAASQPPDLMLDFHPVQITGILPPPGGLPPNRIADHEKLVKDDAARYLTQLETALASRDRDLVAASIRASNLQVKTDYNQSLQKRITELRDKAVSQARALQIQLNQLNYRLAALESQKVGYSNSGFNARRNLEDVRLQQIETERRSQLKTTEIAGTLGADFAGLAREELKPYLAKLEADAVNQATIFRAQQTKSDQQEIAEAKSRIDAQPAPIPPLMDHSTEISNPGAAQLGQNIEAPSISVFDTSSKLILAGDRSRIVTLKETINQLVDLIDKDNQKTVDAIARRDKWIAVRPGSAPDWTSKVQSEMKNQWSVVPGHK